MSFDHAYVHLRPPVFRLSPQAVEPVVNRDIRMFPRGTDYIIYPFRGRSTSDALAPYSLTG